MVRFARVCLAAVLMCHPQVIRSRQRMRHDGGHTMPYQGNCEGLRALPLKSMECGFFHGTGVVSGPHGLSGHQDASDALVGGWGGTDGEPCARDLARLCWACLVGATPRCTQALRPWLSPQCWTPAPRDLELVGGLLDRAPDARLWRGSGVGDGHRGGHGVRLASHGRRRVAGVADKWSA
jgi:hypothetical protein